jgi:hypothetical protein
VKVSFGFHAKAAKPTIPNYDVETVLPPFERFHFTVYQTDANETARKAVLLTRPGSRPFS